MLNYKENDVEAIVKFEKYIIFSPDSEKGKLISRKKYESRKKIDDEMVVESGSLAIFSFLKKLDLDTLEKRAEELREKEMSEDNNDRLDIGNDIDFDLDSINLGESLSINEEIELDGIEEL